MPKVLVVTRHFPPIGSVGASIRIVKFLKFLSKDGWSFIVLTQDPERPAVTESDGSDFMLSELPESVEVFRIAAPLTVSGTRPDNSILKNISSLGWALLVVIKAFSLIRNKKIDLIYTAIPVIANALICVILHKIYKIPFVLDIKDDYVGSVLYHSKSRFRRWVERGVERLVINNSSGFSVVTQHSLYAYQQRYPDIAHKFHLIPNGCDVEEFQKKDILVRKNPQEKFLILNSATRYQSQYRDAKPFIQALGKLLANRPELKSKIDVVFLGNSLSCEYDSLITELDLTAVIRNMPAQQRDDYRWWLNRAGLYLLIQPLKNLTAIAGTLYEYWAVGAGPILLISEKGSSYDLVTSHRLGRWFDFDDIEGIEFYIYNVYAAFMADTPVTISPDGIENYDRSRLASLMGQYWLSCINNHEK